MNPIRVRGTSFSSSLTNNWKSFTENHWATWDWQTLNTKHTSTPRHAIVRMLRNKFFFLRKEARIPIVLCLDRQGIFLYTNWLTKKKTICLLSTYHFIVVDVLTDLGIKFKHKSLCKIYVYMESYECQNEFSFLFVRNYTKELLRLIQFNRKFVIYC